MEYPSAERGKIVGLSEKAAAEGEVGPFSSEGIHQTGDIRDAVLPVGIESDHDVGAMRQGKIDPRLQGGTLTKIDRMYDHVGAGGCRDVACPVAGAIIDHADLVSGAAELCDDAPDHGRLVVSSANDP